MGNAFKIKSIIYIIVGSLSLIFSVVCFASDTGTFENLSSYGGDAYTGIQNAGALTANNIKCLASICSFGFGAIFLLVGILILSKGILSLVPTSKQIVQMGNASQAMPSDKLSSEPSITEASASSRVSNNTILPTSRESADEPNQNRSSC